MAQPAAVKTQTCYPGGISQRPNQSATPPINRFYAQGSCELRNNNSSSNALGGNLASLSKRASHFKSEPALVSWEHFLDDEEEEDVELVDAVGNDVVSSEDYLNNAATNWQSRHQTQRQEASKTVVCREGRTIIVDQNIASPATTENYAVTFPKLQASFV